MKLATKSKLESELYSAICRIANEIDGADELPDDDFDEAVAMAVYDAAMCLAELLPNGGAA